MSYRLKLEQLECLRSEDTPAASWLPIPLSHIDPKSKEDKVKFTNLKNSPNFKLLNFEMSITRDTPSEFAW